MKKKTFNELTDSIKEAGAIRRGEKEPSRRFSYNQIPPANYLEAPSELFSKLRKDIIEEKITQELATHWKPMNPEKLHKQLKNYTKVEINQAVWRLINKGKINLTEDWKLELYGKTTT